MDITDRLKIEKDELWGEWRNEPLLEMSLPNGWRIRPIPAFMGAMVRFIIITKKYEYSVYFDSLDRLGFMRYPYFEVLLGYEAERFRTAQECIQAIKEYEKKC